jgi:hypothetical protein
MFISIMAIDINQLRLALSTLTHTKLLPEDFTRYYTSFGYNIDLGGTFRPEDFDSTEHALTGLEALNSIGIKKLRLGIRWSRVQPKPDKIDLSMYFPILDYMVKNKFEITLNIGPIKSAGWPEQFIPDWVLAKCDITKGSRVQCDSELGKYAIEYLEKVSQALSKKYKSKDFIIIQPENECFKKFGELELLASEEYLVKVVETINKHFDTPKILFNSSGRREVKQFIAFINKSKLENQFVLGYNYYFVTDSTAKSYVYTRYFDDFVMTHFDTPKIRYTQENIEYETSECQFEPWGRAKWPGNNYEAFTYGLLRCLQVARGCKQKKYLVRLWGVENLAKNILKDDLTDEHKLIIQLIKNLNKV